ncbi:MAG TPA: lycopene cyclase family protein [Rhodocyclaceae bacterium]|nr:lycopene cyclase family protein [Rhodocyclaceae bacterium]
MSGRFEGHVVVLGGGPAGAATAIGLARRGYSVTVIGEPRRFRAVEGVSERVFAALHDAGFEQALTAVQAPSPRRVAWNGRISAANTERLVDRQAFDRGLRADLARHRVALIDARVSGWSASGSGAVVEIGAADGSRRVEADFVVEARGRAAPHAAAPRVRGRETVSILQYWHGPHGAAASAVESFEDGWAWMAGMPDGARYLQLTLDVASGDLPGKRYLGDYCRARLERLEAAHPFMAGAAPLGEPYARTSTPVLVEALAGERWLRVGDAAMAVDPLSGNGIFQALSSALQAPAVIATMLERPVDAALARGFHHGRVTSLFERFARIGRDFYALETRWPERAFWRTRSTWPDAEPSHPAVTPQSVRIDSMAVVCDGYIAQREVVVTPDQPLGVWHVGGLPVAPVLRILRETGGADDPVEAVCGALAVDRARAAAVLAWIRRHSWV